jgi:hypothetical protein
MIYHYSDDIEELYAKLKWALADIVEEFNHRPLCSYHQTFIYAKVNYLLGVTSMIYPPTWVSEEWKRFDDYMTSVYNEASWMHRRSYDLDGGNDDPDF